MSANTRRLFFSYTHLYRGIASEMLESLAEMTETNPVRDWFFYGNGPIKLGLYQDVVINQHIDRAEAVVVLLTREYLERRNCMAEMCRALEQDKPLLVLLLGPSDLVDALNLQTNHRFGNRAYKNIAEDGVRNGLSLVAEHIRECVLTWAKEPALTSG